MGAGFETLGLEPPLLQAVREMGIGEPFPIQATAIAPLLEGRDLIGQAHTGAGKTLAFALPMLQKIDQRAPGIQGLVIVPTRELALQVAREFEKLAKHLRIRIAAIYGGQSMRLQTEKLRNHSCAIIIATPGRLIDHLDRRTVSLDKTSFVVLDEADRMLDMGFIDDVRLILSHVSRIHQTALFSATISNEIVKLAQRYMKNPLRVFVDTDEPTVDSVEQKFVRIDEGGKFPALRALLNHEHITKGLIFCETKARAGGLAQALQDEHYKALALHSDLSQFQRDSAVHSFRIGMTDLLVATEVAARGLDIPKVSHVVNYDMPEEPKMYFHRIGRTARAGKPGVALSLITRQDEDGFKRIRKMTSSDLREVTDGIPPENRGGSKFLLPTRPSQRQAGQRLSSGRRPRRYNRRERSFRRNRRR
jgi:ATP-dependent RNA helicase DeaD